MKVMIAIQEQRTSEMLALARAESAIILINLDDGDVASSTRIDNKRISTSDQVRIAAGKDILYKQRPDWEVRDKQPKRPKAKR